MKPSTDAIFRSLHQSDPMRLKGQGLIAVTNYRSVAKATHLRLKEGFALEAALRVELAANFKIDPDRLQRIKPIAKMIYADTSASKIKDSL